MIIRKKYIVNLSNNFEGEMKIMKTLFLEHKPRIREVRELMKRFKCKYVHVGTYYKRIGPYKEGIE